jgi:hypothetical protein
MATTGSISLKDQELERGRSKPDGYHGYHERSCGDCGLHLDSTEAHSWGPSPQVTDWKFMKVEDLGVVARDGLEPPTPAFSGLLRQP